MLITLTRQCEHPFESSHMKIQPIFRADGQLNQDVLKNDIEDLSLNPDSPIESRGAFTRSQDEYAGLKRNGSHKGTGIKCEFSGRFCLHAEISFVFLWLSLIL